jgi:hypothetical protein
MSHSFDFAGLNQKLFLLRHLIAGTREYCRREQLRQGTRDYESDEWVGYAGRLRHIVSNDLIEVAAKFRVIQDSATTELTGDYLRDTDEASRRNCRIGSVLVGEFELTVRESCNKIIHATDFELVMQNARNSNPYYPYSYWNGVCRLRGIHSKKDWRIALDVYKWSEALDYFLDDLAANVDWSW